MLPWSSSLGQCRPVGRMVEPNLSYGRPRGRSAHRVCENGGWNGFFKRPEVSQSRLGEASEPGLRSTKPFKAHGYRDTSAVSGGCCRARLDSRRADVLLTSPPMGEAGENAPFSICESCRERVDPDDPNVVSAFEQKEIVTAAGKQRLDGLIVYFHRGCFPGGNAYRLAQ
jgi:hypothetical protein